MWNFLGNCSKIPFLAQKREERPPGPHWDPPGWQNFFFELAGYENPMVEKRIFELSPIEKSWCVQTRPLADIFNFVLFHDHRTRNLGGISSRILQNTSKHKCANALASSSRESLFHTPIPLSIISHFHKMKQQNHTLPTIK